MIEVSVELQPHVLSADSLHFLIIASSFSDLACVLPRPLKLKWRIGKKEMQFQCRALYNIKVEISNRRRRFLSFNLSCSVGNSPQGVCNYTQSTIQTVCAAEMALFQQHMIIVPEEGTARINSTCFHVGVKKKMFFPSNIFRGLNFQRTRRIRSCRVS